MSRCAVDVGEEAPIFKYIHAKLESEFLTSRTSSFNKAKLGPFPSMSILYPLTSLHDECSQTFTVLIFANLHVLL